MSMSGGINTAATDIAGARVAPPYRYFVPSWLAYIRPVLVLAAFGFVGGIGSAFFPLGGSLLLAGGVLLFIYQVMFIHSVKLFTQDDGVWVYSGVFPWDTGVYGVKWRDLNEATFRQTFTGWLFGSFTVTLTNRYTEGDEIRLPHIKRGDDAATHINDLHIARVRAAGDVGPNALAKA